MEMFEVTLFVDCERERERERVGEDADMERDEAYCETAGMSMSSDTGSAKRTKRAGPSVLGSCSQAWRVGGCEEGLSRRDAVSVDMMAGSAWHQPRCCPAKEMIGAKLAL